MAAYVAMGCRPTWTCAPYQLSDRPSLGEHVAWAESNAIVFANSVLGARTNRYGDFIDLCAAVTGRVPDHGLHTDEGRRATVRFRLHGVSDRLLDQDLLYPVLGHLLGRRAGTEVAAIDGLPPTTSEDRLKALGAAAAMHDVLVPPVHDGLRDLIREDVDAEAGARELAVLDELRDDRVHRRRADEGHDREDHRDHPEHRGRQVDGEKPAPFLGFKRACEEGLPVLDDVDVDGPPRARVPAVPVVRTLPILFVESSRVLSAVEIAA